MRDTAVAFAREMHRLGIMMEIEGCGCCGSPIVEISFGDHLIKDQEFLMNTRIRNYEIDTGSLHENEVYANMQPVNKEPWMVDGMTVRAVRVGPYLIREEEITNA